MRWSSLFSPWVHLKLTWDYPFVRTGPVALDWSWLVVLSCHRNFKTSKCWSALSSKVKPFLETALIQRKRRKFIIKVSIISSHKFHSRKQTSEKWWLKILWSPWNVGRLLSVLIHELVQKFHDFPQFFSLYLTETTLIQNDLCSTKSDFPVVRFVECSLFFFQLVQASISCPPAAISSRNLRDESTSRLTKETESHYISSKKFKRTWKVHTNGKKQRSSSKSGDQSTNN